MFARLRSLVGALARRRTFETELDEEIGVHIEQYARDLIRSGVSEEDAYRQARLELGGLNTVKGECREARGLGAFDALQRECRYAARQLRRSPGFAGTVVLTLALAIGVNTAVFSLVNALLLEALPYAQPDRIGTLHARTTGVESAEARRTIDGEQWERMRDDVSSVVAAVATTATSGANIRAGAVVRYVRTGRVSARYFDVLALHPILGRPFTADEDRPHGPNVAILSHALWRVVFAGRPDAIGQAVMLKGEPYTVVGVLPEGATTPLDADVYTALQPGREGEGRAANFRLVMRLRDGATWPQADAELHRALSASSRFQDFIRTHPGTQLTYRTVPLQQSETGALRPQVLALMIAAGLTVLIASANIAGLSLVRTLRRTHEITIRLALGASRWQVQRQLWIEHLLLATMGGAVGLGVGALALRGLLQLLPERVLPVASVTLDGRVLGFTMLLALMTCVLSGALPALAMGGVSLRSAAPGRGVIGGGHLRLRQMLIGGEVALTVVLLAAAGLLVRTLIGLQTIPPGFNPDGLITAKVSLDDARYHDPRAFQRLLSESLTAMRRIPGVQGAAVALTLPYERAVFNAVKIGSGRQAGRSISTNHAYVTPDYFDTLQIGVLEGRAFTDADGPDDQPVAIVNRSFAHKFYGGESPVGQYLDDNVVIVGIVADTVLSAEGRLNPGTAPLTYEEMVYIPAAQVADARMLAFVHGFFQPSWIVRTEAPAGVPARMQHVLASVDPDLTMSGVFRMRDLMATTLARQRVAVALLVVMSSIALLLSAVGIFALVASVVAQRTRDIGLLMALGATVPQTIVRVGRAPVLTSGFGLVLGLILCAVVLPAMRSVLYGVGVYDLPTLLAVALTLAAVILLATTPVLKIARIDPARALRED